MDLSQLRWSFETMTRIRIFEETVATLVEQGHIKTPCHFCIGQEAIPAGVSAALLSGDYVWGAHRSHGHYLAKGGSTTALMAEIFCRVDGCSGGRGGSMHVCAPEHGVMGTVPIVAATVPLAVGAALANQLRGNQRVSVSYFGDGALEEGHVHESMNLAAVRKLPVIFVCENNLYSSHMSLLERRSRDNIPDTGAAHGLATEQIDGNDVEAMYTAAVRAVHRARTGAGPTLLECRTFRWRGHVGPAWDMDVGVRRNDEVQQWLLRDPILRCAQRLQALGLAAAELAKIEGHVRLEIESAVETAQQSPHPEPADVANHVYSAAA